MFKYKYKIPKNEIKTTYGSICINNIVFEPDEIEKILPEIVLEDDNLKHMFAEEELNDFKKRNIYKRFIPQEKLGTDLLGYIQSCIRTNRTFYSFLAEGILGLVYRDVYGYDLAKCVIDVRDTLADSHTGVDACMYDSQGQIVVLGEAKFYENLDDGIKAIINDFTHKSIKNKLESMKTAAENNLASYRIVIKNLGIEEYEEQTVEEFMNQKILFAGFVLHSEDDVEKYCDKEFYDKYDITSEKLENNICNSLELGDLQGECNIVLVHLPVRDKKGLIIKMIEASKVKLQKMQRLTDE